MKISGKIQRATDEALAFAGLIVLGRQILFTLRRDLWSSPGNIASDYVWSEIQKYVESIPGVKLYEVTFTGAESEWVPVAARSEESLADRIGWITGQHVAELREYHPVRVAEEKKHRAAEPEPLPDYPCAERTRILAERAERDTKFDYATKVPPARRGL